MIDIDKANELLAKKSPTITDFPSPMSKGTIHDYYSNGSYWWPNPETENHLPYIRRDGELNPENFTKHKDLILQLSLDTSTLYRAYKQTNNKIYISKLEENLVSFFVDPKTKMNPSLMYSQAIPGICEGRSIGLIDTLQLIDIPVIVSEMIRDGIFSQAAPKGLSEWFNTYSNWLISSDFGIAESNEKNNHSITYYAQLAAFSLLSKNKETIHSKIREIFKSKLITQMGVDGFFPQEIKRSRSFGYSMFVVDNLSTIALLTSTKNDNLWSYRNMIKKAIDAIFPYIQDKTKWPYGQDIEMWNTMPSKSTFLYFASKAYGEIAYLDTWNKLKEPDLNYPSEARHIPVKTPEAYLSFLDLE